MTLSDILTLSTAVVGIVFSYLLFVKSKRNKEPCWDVKSNNLIRNFSSNIPKLEILYGKEKVENLTVSRIIFWNNGAETLERSHIVIANPLRISVKQGVKILDAEVLVSNNPHSDFSLIKSNDELSARIELEYLDKNDGAVIQIIHTGVSSIDISIDGSIKGVKRIYIKRVIELNNSTTFSKLYLSSLVIFISVFISVLSILTELPKDSQLLLFPQSFSRADPTVNMYIAGIFTYVIFSGIFVIYWLIRTKIPKGLEIFKDELLI